MPQRCTACSHPKRDALNKDLLEAKTTLAEIAQRYGLTKSSLDRHKANHLKVSTQALNEQRNALTIIGYAHTLYERACAVLDRAEALLRDEDGGARSVQAASASLREVRGSIELLARLVVATPDEPPATENSWIDQAIAQELAAMRPPELPAGAALPSGVEDAVLVHEPEGA